MGRRAVSECTIEEFNAWCEARGRLREVHAVANEIGGPELSLVPREDKASANPCAEGPDDLNAAVPFEPEPSRKRTGWSALRQRMFILILAETGSVHQAAAESRMAVRSAYALRVRSAPFREAWDTAQQLAVGRLSALAFDRAINGRAEQTFIDGNLVAEKRLPSDRLLMWLLTRLDPRRFALPWEQRGEAADPQAAAATAMPGRVDAIVDADTFGLPE